MPLKIAPGSVEFLACRVTDILPSPDQITTLAGKNPRFEVYATDEAETLIVPPTNASVATGDPMVGLCLIDADIPGVFPEEGDYNLFFIFDSTPETPRLGPFRFRIDD